jgi:hypothetical protein
MILFSIILFQLILDQIFIQFYCMAILIIIFFKFLQMHYRSPFLLLNAEIKIFSKYWSLKIFDSHLILNRDRLNIQSLIFLRFERFVKNIERMSIQFLFIDRVNRPHLTLIQRIDRYLIIGFLFDGIYRYQRRHFII